MSEPQPRRCGRRSFDVASRLHTGPASRSISLGLQGGATNYVAHSRVLFGRRAEVARPSATYVMTFARGCVRRRAIRTRTRHRRSASSALCCLRLPATVWTFPVEADDDHTESGGCRPHRSRRDMTLATAAQHLQRQDCSSSCGDAPRFPKDGQPTVGADHAGAERRTPSH